MNENPGRGLHLGKKRLALRQEHRKRAVWWLSAGLIALLVAYFLPVEQIEMRGDQLKGLVGGQGYGGPGWLPPWLGPPATGDDPARGDFVSNGHHFHIQYIGTDTTAGHTDPATFSRPTVSVQVSSGTWYGGINGIPIDDYINNYWLTNYYLDWAPNYGTGTYWYGPISTEAYGIPNMRGVAMGLSSTSGGTVGSVQAQSNYPFFAYKVTCSDPPSGADEFGIGISTAQGYAVWGNYIPMFNVSGTAHVEAHSAAGFQFVHDYSYNYDPNYPEDGANLNVGPGGGNTEVALAYPHNQNIEMQPVGDGTFVGYLYVTAIPICSVSMAGNDAALVEGEADWYVIPFSVTSPP